MKRILYFPAMICIILSLLVGCKEDKEPEPIILTNLSIEGNTSFSVGASASKESFIVIANKDWTISSESSWITFSPASGKADSRMSVEITISANAEPESRSAVITITAADKTAQIEIFQEGKEIIIITGIEIPDENFKQYLIDHFDLNGDGVITEDEAEAVTFMDCSGQAIESMAGLEYFVNLDTLVCNDNLLTELEISKNVGLKMLNCEDNAIESLDVSNNPEITSLHCRSNQLNELILTKASKLTELYCSSNSLTGIDFSAQSALETLDCSDNQLTVLDLSAQSALTSLVCSDNQLTVLDLSAQSALTSLVCSNNQLTGLNLSTQGVLTTLDCSNNKLTGLNLSTQGALTAINCSNNQLKVLDVSKNTELKTLDCASNQLAVLDVSLNALLENLNCINNNSLTEILLAEDQIIAELTYDNEITQLVYPEPPPPPPPPPPLINLVNIPDANFKAYLVSLFDTDKDGEISEEEALAIKEIRCLQLDIVSVTGIESFPNLEFLSLIGNKVTSLDITNNLMLKEMIFMDNKIGYLDVSKNVLLTRLVVSNCELSNLDVSANTSLLELNCSNNYLNSLDISNNLLLDRLYCQSNNLRTLDLRKNKALTRVYCRNNPYLTTVTLEQGQNVSVDHDSPPTTVVQANYVDIKDEALLAFLLEKFDTDGDQKISEAEIKSIAVMDCSNRNIQSLEDLRLFTNLTSLTCSGNKLTTLNIGILPQLVTLVCDHNQLSDLDISRNTALVTLDCSHNQLTYLSTSTNKELKSLACNDNLLTSLDVDLNTKLETLLCQNNMIGIYIFLNNNLSLRTMNCINNPPLARLFLQTGQTIQNLIYDEDVTSVRYIGGSTSGGGTDAAITIPDSKFKDYLILHFDRNGDGAISEAEALLVKSIDCSGLSITSLVGIENFTNLTSLVCNTNPISSIPLSQLTALETLDCSNSQISSLDVSNLVNLKNLYCQRNLLTTLNVTNNKELSSLDCHDNMLTSLNVRLNPKLRTLVCNNNFPGFTIYISSSQASLVSITRSPDAIIESTSITGVTTITDVIFEDYLISNFDKNGDGIIDPGELALITDINCSRMNISTLAGIESFPNIAAINCSYNNLTALDFSSLTKLKILYCHDNKLTAINVTGCLALEMFYCPGNLVTTLDVSTNPALAVMDCTENPQLTTVYVSQAQFDAGKFVKDNHTNFVVK